MTAQILQCKTRNTEQPFYLSIKISCYLAVFFLSRKHRENFKYLDAIHYLIQYYKLVFKGKSEGDDTFFFAFIYNFHIAIAQGFGQSACISASHSEPLVTIVTV